MSAKGRNARHNEHGERFNMRILLPAALAASLIATNLYAADTSAPLAPGKPAGVLKADDVSGAVWVALGLAAVIAVLAVVAPSGGGTTTGVPSSTTS
jgi:hypothetical protein